MAQQRSATLADQISTLLDVTGYRAMLRESRAESTEGRLENIQELILLAGGLPHRPGAARSRGPGDRDPDDDAGGRVRLMTMHKAKGLEFRHVFLPGWEANSFPPPYGEIAEERRLAYVALTRGMRRVTVTHCEFRRGYADASTFVDDIPPQHRIEGWLRSQKLNQPVPKRQRTLVDALNDLELARRF